jgi:hypothetical protein
MSRKPNVSNLDVVLKNYFIGGFSVYFAKPRSLSEILLGHQCLGAESAGFRHNP